MAVFGNLALDPGARALAKRDFSSASSPADSVASEALRFPHVVGRWIGSKRGDGETTRLAAAAIGNGCADPAWRAACVSGVHGATLVRRLFEALPVRRSGDENARERTPANAVPVGLGLGLDDARRLKSAAEAADFETAASVLAALSNVLLEPSARAWVRTNAKRVVEKLLPWLLVTGDANVTDVADAETSAVVASRAAATLSRCAREKETTRALLSARGAGGALAVCDLVAQTAQRVLATETSDPSFAAAAAALDGGTRVLALAAAFSRRGRRRRRRRRRRRDGRRGDGAGRGARRGVVAGGVRVFAESPRRRRRQRRARAGGLGAPRPRLGVARVARARRGALPAGGVPRALRRRAEKRRHRVRAAARRAPHMAALKEHHGLELIYAYVALKTGRRDDKEDKEGEILSSYVEK